MAYSALRTLAALTSSRESKYEDIKKHLLERHKLKPPWIAAEKLRLCQCFPKLGCNRYLGLNVSQYGCSCAAAGSRNKCAYCQASSFNFPLLDEICTICQDRLLSGRPHVQLTCAHKFHIHCCKEMLQRRWPGPAISLQFSKCPVCKADIDHPIFSTLLQGVKAIREDVHSKALMRLEYEGLSSCNEVTSRYSEFFSNPLGYALTLYEFYECFKCKKAYYGGRSLCGGAAPAAAASEYVCGECIGSERGQLCAKHGAEYIQFKCRYCCSLATFFCFGTTHFCKVCHDNHVYVTQTPQSQLPRCPAGPGVQQLPGNDCPLHVSHAKTGDEFVLGCGMCPDNQRFWKA